MRTRVLCFALALPLAGVTGVGVFVYSGWYNVAATDAHTAVTYWVLETTMRRSVQRRAAGIPVPPLADAEMIQRGGALYDAHCAECHGAPGSAPSAFALGLTPAAANLSHTARVWKPAELYWVIRNGIKMSGMPAWAFRLPDADLWALVAFLQRLPFMTPQQYASRNVAPLHTGAFASAPGDPEADPVRGAIAVRQYGCVSCHSIPGIVEANASVGPPLDKIATRGLIAGMLPNTPEHLERWLREPRTINPRSAMPNLGVTERDARDMAAFLYTLK
jgi:mono/diheme cytochrome c family protein